MNTVYVECDEISYPIRIFKTRKDWLLFDGKAAICEKSIAVKAIRDAVIKRDNGECKRCGERVGNNGHLDERVPRSKGGEISIDNSWLLCADCHILRPESQHGDRRWGGRKD